jgi:hypothetical protein
MAIKLDGMKKKAKVSLTAFCYRQFLFLMFLKITFDFISLP